jgi:hypothetical protein
MMAGANPAAVQRILRHSDPRITTEVYGHLAPGYLRAEIDRLHFLGSDFKSKAFSGELVPTEAERWTVCGAHQLSSPPIIVQLGRQSPSHCCWRTPMYGTSITKTLIFCAPAQVTTSGPPIMLPGT